MALALIGLGLAHPGQPPSRSGPTGRQQPSASRAVAQGVERPDGIRVRGAELVSDSGRPVVLHGVDMSGTEYACAQNHTDDPFAGQPESSPQTLAAMRSWHIDAVRIPLNEDCWLGINGVRIGGAAYQRAIVNLVNQLQSSGFYVILDLHWSAPGTQRALTQNPGPDQDHSPTFWASVAKTFKGDPDVIFDLFNEPYYSWMAKGSGGVWSCLWQGCTLTRYLTGSQPASVAADWRTAGMDELISTVRRSGARNLILVAGVDWANDLSQWLRGRPRVANVAASWHSYPQNRCSTKRCWGKTIASLARRVPVVVTETGDTTHGPAKYLARLLPWCDHHGIGYLAWTWNAWPKSKDVLVTNMATGAPTRGEGAYYRQHLLQLSRQR